MTIIVYINEAAFKVVFSPLLNRPFAPTIMSHKKFVIDCETSPLGYLISTPKALCILLAYKLRDGRLQLFLLECAVALLAFLGAAICGFYLMPMFLALGLLAHGVGLFAFLLWFGAGDIFLTFVLEDERFHELATQSHALSVFEDTENSEPQPGN
jgi:hypothetical protein